MRVFLPPCHHIAWYVVWRYSIEQGQEHAFLDPTGWPHTHSRQRVDPLSPHAQTA